VIGTVSPEQVDALNTIMGSQELRTSHVQALLAFARENNVPGVQLDYRALDAALGAGFTAFVEELAAGLQGEGRALDLMLPMPVQQGETWDTRGFDWTALAAAADALVPAFDAAQPYAQLESAVAYMVARAGGGKLLLSVSSLSHEQSTEGVRALPLGEALTLASSPVAETDTAVTPGSTLRASAQNLSPALGGSGPAWDQATRSVVFSYPGAGGERTVWIGNVFSESFKLDLAQRHQLAGVVVDDVSRAAGEANIWPAVQAYAESGEVTLSEPNGDLLTPRWLASGGSFASDAGSEVDWQAPAESGDYTLTLVVSDGVVRVGQELLVPVVQPAAVAP
jgi:spore germination protein YaaH